MSNYWIVSLRRKSTNKVVNIILGVAPDQWWSLVSSQNRVMPINADEILKAEEFTLLGSTPLANEHVEALSNRMPLVSAIITR